jgi:Cu+-exporting ATPase
MSETTIDLPVLGMTCAACVRRVEHAVAALPGVAKAEVNLPLSRARIVLDPERATTRGVADAIRDAGYEVPADLIDAQTGGAARLAAIQRAEHDEVRALRRDAVIAFVLTVPLLVIAMAHGLVPELPSIIVQLALGTVVFLGPGMRYVRRGLVAIRHASPDMNTLIALGAGAAWLSSTITSVQWLAGPRHHMPDVYFEAGAAIISFVMIGKLLESRARARVSDAVRGLMSLAPAAAHRPDGTDVEAAALVAGDVVLVRPGERLPADGTIVEGTSTVDESLLTGESLPVDKSEGSPAYAGTLNHQGVLTLRIARAGGDTALARIARAVEDAQGDKAPIARLADRVSAYFVPAVLVIAAGTAVAWWISGAETGVAIERMVAVLVIACPCALGLATPAAVAVGTSRAAELGVLFTGGGALERAAEIDVVCLDKTGTLTSGKPALVEVVPVGRERDELLALVAAAEQASEHPIARAIADGARARGLTPPLASDVTIEPGAGLRAQVGGHTVLVGTRDYLALAEVDVARLPADAGPGTRSYVAVDRDPAGMIVVADPVAPAAREALERLRALGIEPLMVTGDREEAARAIATELGITRVHAGVRPTAKAAIVTAERATGRHVAMVGDGINDAPALAAAELGVALASGTDIAAAAADVTLLRGGIANLPTMFTLARRTMHVIRRNLVAAFAYNLVCIPIAAAGLLSPVLASAAMSLSSVSVLVSSLRLRRA